MKSFLKHRLGDGLLKKNKMWKIFHEVDICDQKVLAAALS